MLESIKIVIIIATGFANILLGGAIFLRNPNSSINRVFLVICQFFALWAFCLLMYDHPLVYTSLFWIRATYVVAALIVICTLFFSFIFPKPIYKQFVPYAYGVSGLFMAFTIWLLYFTNLWVIDVVTTVEKGQQTILGPGYAFWVLAIWIVLIWSLFNFASNRKNASGREKKQLEYLFYGFSLWGISVSIIDVIIPLVFSETRLFSIGITTSLFFTVSVGYAIVKHRFFDIRLVLARSIAYSILVICLGTVYAGGLFVAGTYFLSTSTSMGDLLVSTSLALVVAISFQPLKNLLEQVTDRIFYKEDYNAQELLGNLSRIMASTAFLSYMAELLLKELLLRMKISSGFLVLIKGNQINWIKSEGEVIQASEFNPEKIIGIINWGVQQGSQKIIVYDELDDSKEKWVMQKHNLAVVLPLVIKNEIIGAMLFGGKSSGDVYSSKDLQVLKIIAPEVAIAVNNAISYEEITKFNIRLEKEVKQATEELQNANIRLKELDRLKDEFVSLASHELRTPMTVIKDYLWMVLQQKVGDVNDKQRLYLERAYSSTQRLINLVNDMLNVSRIESGRITLDLKSTEITSLIQKICTEMQVDAIEHNVHLNFKQPEEKIPAVLADPDRIEQVLINLIGNAIKFTPAQGVITVSVGIRNNMAIVSVLDTGKGIKKEDFPRLFQKFGILDSGYAKEHNLKSTGLGLYISKSLVKLHGGVVWAESEGDGKGSTFSFSLKLFEDKNLPNTQVQIPDTTPLNTSLLPQ